MFHFYIAPVQPVYDMKATTYFLNASGVIMHFKKNTDVLTHNRKTAGQIDRVVINPATDDVSHLVVKNQ